MYDQSFWQEPPREEEDEEGDGSGRKRRPKPFTPSTSLPKGKMVQSDHDGGMVLDAAALTEDDPDAMDALLAQMLNIRP